MGEVRKMEENRGNRSLIRRMKVDGEDGWTGREKSWENKR